MFICDGLTTLHCSGYFAKVMDEVGLSAVPPQRLGWLSRRGQLVLRARGVTLRNGRRPWDVRLWDISGRRGFKRFQKVSRC